MSLHSHLSNQPSLWGSLSTIPHGDSPKVVSRNGYFSLFVRNVLRWLARNAKGMRGGCSLYLGVLVDASQWEIVALQFRVVAPPLVVVVALCILTLCRAGGWCRLLAEGWPATAKKVVTRGMVC